MAVEERANRLVGPDALALGAVHPAGPLAGRVRPRLQLAALDCTFRNSSSERVEVAAGEVEPLRKAADGASATGRLTAKPAAGGSLPVTLSPGDVVTLRIGGEVQLPPGRYVSRLLLTDDAGKPVVSVPLTVTVRAHWLWAVGFMLVGLAFLGLLLLLADRAALNNRLADVLSEQQDLHELLEASPPTMADRPLARQARESVAAAVEALSGPRPFGLVDLRLARAEDALEEARAALAALRSRIDGRTPGRVAVDELDGGWKELTERLETARRNLAPVPAVVGDRSRLVPGLEALQRGMWQQRLVPLLLGIERGLGPHVERARLALAAGEEERARELAELVTLWQRRAARELDRESELMLTWRSFADEMLAREAFLEQALADPELPETARRPLVRSLDAARHLLEPASLEGFRDAAKVLHDAETELLRERSRQLIEQVQGAIAAVEERTSLERIMEALDHFPQDAPKEARGEHLLTVLGHWRWRVASLTEVEERERFLARISDLESLIEAGDLAAAAEPFKELLDSWTAYQDAETERAMAEVIVPYCRQQAVALRAQQQASADGLALLQPHPDLTGIEARLERVASELDAGFSPAECLERTTDLSGELLEIGDRLFTTLLQVADLSAEQRLASAAHSEVAAAVSLARRLMLEPRRLRLELRTPPAEVRVDRRVTLQIGNLDPSWGPWTLARIDFDDGSQPLLTNAEELRRQPLVHHRYARSQPVDVRVVMEEGKGEEVLQQGGEVVGLGRLAVTVAPSPISIARSLAGFFLSTRFVLALTLGLLIQGWRFYDSQRPFGSLRRDYLEAFALGLGILGVVEGFASTLTQFTQVG